MRKLNYMKTSLLFFYLFTVSITAQTKEINLSKTGEVNYWYAAGPFDQPIKGFGDIGDEEIINENSDINHLFHGQNKNIEWQVKSINKNGFMDFNNIFSKTVTDSISKIWFVKCGYAFAVVNSDKNYEAEILFGGNSIAKIIQNGEMIYESTGIRNAVKDETKKNIKLRKGENYFLLKIANSHKNFGLSFFLPTNFEWGFYFRINSENKEGITETIFEELNEEKLNITPTFFIKNIEGENLQKLYVDLINSNFNAVNAFVKISCEENVIEKKIKGIKYGYNNIELYIPELTKAGTVTISIDVAGRKIEKSITAVPPVHYQLYLMQLSHTDIGYTHTQPIVKERHIKTIDEVIIKCKTDPNFKWTIETLWILENYRKAKTKKDFDEIIKLIKDGRIYVSPIYTNPFTGLISENEAHNSLELSKKYKKEYGLEFNSAVYNDVPGQSWFLPKVLQSAGVPFLANGINEIYNDYQYQKNLPKVFIWQGADSSQIINYLTESYVEGMQYGLERDNYVIENRMWERIQKLNMLGYNYDMILLNAAFTDNAGIPDAQLANALKWNEEYEYPKFIVSTLSDFAEEFIKKYSDHLPVVKGDYTSAWDILNQGEFERSVRLRETQRRMKSAEILSGMSWLINDNYKINSKLIDKAYDNSLHLTGHGSGLELGFGTLAENKITDDFREQYSLNAYLYTEELYERSVYELTKNMESFQNFGAIVFNTSSIQQNKIVDVGFSALENANYSVFDLSNNQKVKSYYDGSKVTFEANNIPQFGYKKFKFVGETSDLNTVTNSKTNFIENEFYKIIVDTAALTITSVYDKQLKKELLEESSFGFFPLTQKKFADSYNLSYENKTNGEVAVSIEGNLSQKITVKNKYSLIPQFAITIYNGLKLIDINADFDYTKLGETDITQNYNFEFPLINHNSEIFIDLLGGEYSSNLKPEWHGNKAFSIRDYVRISNKDYEIYLASPDARIIEIVKRGDKRIIVSNIANNFPENWNRNEKNDKTIKYNFKITSAAPDDITVPSEVFGKSIAAPPVIRKTWFNTEPAINKIIDIENASIIIESVKSISEDEIVLCLSNVSNETVITEINSDHFANKKFSAVDNWYIKSKTIQKQDDKTIKVKFNSNETKLIMVKRN